MGARSSLAAQKFPAPQQKVLLALLLITCQPAIVRSSLVFKTNDLDGEQPANFVTVSMPADLLQAADQSAANSIAGEQAPSEPDVEGE